MSVRVHVLMSAVVRGPFIPTPLVSTRRYSDRSQFGTRLSFLAKYAVRVFTSDGLARALCQSKEEHNVRHFIYQFVRDDEGQDLIEYALLAGFISLVAVVAITNVGTGVNTVYGNVQAQVAAIPGGS